MRPISFWLPHIKKIAIVVLALVIVVFFSLAGRYARENGRVRGRLTGEEVESVHVDSLEQSSEVSGGLDPSNQSPSDTTTESTGETGGLSN